MTVREIILRTLSALELDELREALSGGADSEAKRQYERFLGYASAVIAEIATDYCPLKRVKRLDFAGGILPYGEIDAQLHVIYDVRVLKGGRGRFLEDGIELKRGRYEIEYGVLPRTEENDELPFKSVVSERTVMLGIMTEYYLAAGMIEQAVTFDKRYRDSLYHAARARGVKTVRARRWL